jgi:glycine/D-amino acid oxidase-like deaminating enzyme
MENNKSFWTENFEIEKFEKLKENISTEVCIIGGGITGITTAYYLAKSGIDVVILEKDYIASKTSGHTTGKISAQHGLFYKYLVESYGFNYAKKYAEANIKAIKDIKNIIETENINCNFEFKDSIVYSQEPEKYKELQDEAKVCKDLGIDAEFEDKIDLNIKVQGAVKFKNQAQFNPIKYLDSLCKILVKNGCSIYNNSKVIDYKKENGKIKVIVEGDEENYSVIADNVVVATRYPIFNFPGMYFLKNYQELEYAMCVKLEENIDNFRNVFK